MAEQEGPSGPAGLPEVARSSAYKGDTAEAGGSKVTGNTDVEKGSEGTDESSKERGLKRKWNTDEEGSSRRMESARAGGSKGAADSDVEGGSGESGESASADGSEETGDSDVEEGSKETDESEKTESSERTGDTDVEGGSEGTDESEKTEGSEETDDTDVEEGSEGTDESEKTEGSEETDDTDVEEGSEETGSRSLYRETVLTPRSIQSRNVSFPKGIYVQERYCEKHLVITMMKTSQTSDSMKLMLAKIHELCYIEQWKIVVICEWRHPDFKSLTTSQHQYVDIALLPTRVQLVIRRYVEWVRHRQLTQSSAPEQSLTDVRRMEIISEVGRVFYLNEMAMALIVASVENRSGFIHIDKKLKDDTLIELEWFCRKFREELRADLALGRPHCLC